MWDVKDPPEEGPEEEEEGFTLTMWDVKVSYNSCLHLLYKVLP